MFDLLIKRFVKNYETTDDPKVRESYGTLSSVLSIILNAIMVIFKLFFGYVTGSVAISADGFNNLSDMGSNLATLFGFKMASKHPDSEHPYGHGRIEYIVGMIIAFLILFMGISSLKEAVGKIIDPEKISFSLSALIVLVVAIFIKLWMAFFNKYCAKKIDSSALEAAGQDSLNDVLSTGATLISLVFVLFSDFSLDGYIGLLVSILVIKSGIEIFKSTMDPLLGMAPDKELVDELVKYVKSYEVTKGVHDLMMHDYGPGRRYLSLHVEVDSKDDIMKIHDQIDLIERDILNKYGILTTIHMDPIEVDNKKIIELKEKVSKIVKEINDKYTIHDFRMVSGPTHTNIIFDVVLPADDKSDHEAVKKAIESKIKALDQSYFAIIQIEHSYV